MAKQPHVDINFRDAGDTAIDKAERGVVYLLLHDPQEPQLAEKVFFSVDEIPATYAEATKQQIKLAMTGSYLAPNRVSVIFYPEESFAVEGNEALKLLGTSDCDYLAVPGISSQAATDLGTWVKQHNESQPLHKLKAVLPNTKADNDHVINLTQPSAVTQEGETLKTADLCSLVAGMRAGCQMQFSLDRFRTSALASVPAVDMRSNQDGDNRVKNGEFFFNMDRGRVSVVADVNSLTELAGKDETYQQNKEIDVMDALYNGLKPSILDKYIGKFSNSYQNKLILVAAVDAYLKSFESAGLVEQDDSDCRIDFEAQRLYLKSINYRTLDNRTVETMTEEEILKANTKDHVFLRVRFLPLGAIRHVDILVLT
ncbi:MAG: phage tail sheath C-terminal domain-containing protein [Clostridiales bacterium]|nr:phage tail sheath C-terminal domain-containing protein [Clostridiales bacterium]